VGVGQPRVIRRVARSASAATLLLLAAAMPMSCRGAARDRAAKPRPDAATALPLLREALAVAQKAKDASARADITRQVIYTWAAVDADGALREVKGLPSDQQQDALHAALDALAITDTKRAIELAGETGYHFEDTVCISATGAALARVSPKDAVRFVYRWGEEQAAIAERAVAGALVERDPDVAIALVQSQPDPERPWKQQNMLSSLAEVIARTDSRRAVALAESLPDQNWRDGALGDVISVVAEQDPAEALVLLPQIRDPNIAKWVEPEIAKGFARSDLPRALRMARSMKDLQRDQALAGISYELAATEPNEALRIMRDIGDPSFRDTAAYQLAKVVAERSPPDASEIARQIADGAGSYPPTLFLALGIMARADPDAALEIAVTTPGLGDDVRSAVAEVLGREQPERALSVAGQITNQVIRSEALSGIARARAQVDPAHGIRLASAITEELDRDAALAAIACDLADKHFGLAVATSRKIADDALRATTLCELALRAVGREMPRPDEVP